MASWEMRRQYMSCLQDVKLEISREIDALQMGDVPSGELPLALYKAVAMRQELLDSKGAAGRTSNADLAAAG